MTSKRNTVNEDPSAVGYKTLDQWKAAYLPSVVSNAQQKKLEEDPEALALVLANQTISRFTSK